MKDHEYLMSTEAVCDWLSVAKQPAFYCLLLFYKMSVTIQYSGLNSGLETFYTGKKTFSCFVFSSCFSVQISNQIIGHLFFIYVVVLSGSTHSEI